MHDLLRIGMLLGLLLAGGLYAPAARAIGDCTAPGFVRAFDPAGLPNNTCYEIASAEIRHAGGTGHLRVLGVVGEQRFNTGGAMGPMVEDLAARIGAAMTAMGHLRVNQISVLLTRIPNPDFDND